MVSFGIEHDGKNAIVTNSGELVTAPLHYDEVSYNLLDTDGAIYNFYEPLSERQFVITGFLAVGNKSIAGNPAEAIVEIFEGDSPTANTTNDDYKALVTFAIIASQEISPTLRVLVNPGVWINATMDNDDVHLTMFGYFINRLGN